MIKDPPKKGKDKYLDMLLDQVTEGELRSMNSGDDDKEKNYVSGIRHALVLYLMTNYDTTPLEAGMVMSIHRQLSRKEIAKRGN